MSAAALIVAALAVADPTGASLGQTIETWGEASLEAPDPERRALQAALRSAVEQVNGVAIRSEFQAVERQLGGHSSLEVADRLAAVAEGFVAEHRILERRQTATRLRLRVAARVLPSRAAAESARWARRLEAAGHPGLRLELRAGPEEAPILDALRAALIELGLRLEAGADAPLVLRGRLGQRALGPAPSLPGVDTRGLERLDLELDLELIAAGEDAPLAVARIRHRSAGADLERARERGLRGRGRHAIRQSLDALGPGLERWLEARAEARRTVRPAR